MKKREETHIRKCLLVISMLVLLAGCSEKGMQIYNPANADAEKAEKLFANDTRLTSAVALVTDKDLLMGVRVDTFSRFHKEKIEKELKKELEQLYPELEVTLSADSKIFMETAKLIEKGDTQELDEKLKKLKSLLKEET